MVNNLYVVYAYFEGKPNYKINLQYFLKYGYLPHVNYTFVINGPCTVDFPQRANITIIRRENTGFDFQGYYHGLLSLKKRNLLQNNQYYLFLNCTVRGPFLPPYVTNHIYWYTPYIDLMSDSVKLVGSTINGYISPHVQTYLFVLDTEAVNYLLEKNFFKLCKTREECIKEQEIALSVQILAKGWNINCLVQEYKGLDYRNPETKFIKDDIITSKIILGRDLTPYEVIFVKTNFGDPTNQLTSLTDINLHSLGMVKYNCKKVTYGINEKKVIDVTDILRKMKYTNTLRLQPNNIFGDPFPEQSKMIFVYVEKQAKPFILHELENRIVTNNHLYIFDYRTDLFLFYGGVPTPP